MKKNLLFAILILSMMVYFNGCATIIKGGSQTIPLTSSPDGAEVTVYNSSNTVLYKGTTPTQITIEKGKGYFKKEMLRIVVEKQGYQTRDISLTPSASGWYIGGNLLIGGLIGWLIVDPLTGAMWHFDEQITQNMKLEPHQIAFLNNKQEGLNMVSMTEFDPVLLAMATPVDVE